MVTQHGHVFNQSVITLKHQRRLENTFHLPEEKMEDVTDTGNLNRNTTARRKLLRDAGDTGYVFYFFFFF